MTCPVCDSAERTMVYVESAPDSTIRALADNPGGTHKMARCDDCGVVYDHKLGERQVGSTDPDEMTNCPECGSRISADSSTCSYCDASLDDDEEEGGMF
jgi:hypothetical protein